MNKNVKPIKNLALATVSLAGLLTQSAHAQSELILSSGSSTISVTGNANGLASYNGSVGGWSVDVSTGLAIPSEPSDTIDLNSVSLSVPGTADPLEILWSSTGYTPGTYSASVGGTLSTGISDRFTSYYGGTVGNLTGAAVLTASLAFSGNPFSGSASGVASGASPVLTQEVLISGGSLPFSESSFDFKVAPVAVPESSSIGLLFAGACLAVTKLKRAK